MGKAVDKNLVSYIGLILVYLVLCIGAFELLLIPSVFIKNEKIKDIYIFLIIVIICVIFTFLVRRFFCKNKPRYIDGKYVWKDGCVYEGDWKHNKANGKGKLTWADGSYYEGEFKKGHLSGKGKKVLSNGTIFEGTWVNGFLEGKGKLVGHDGGIYEGEFKKGKPHGMGAITMNNGCYYEGEFKDGKRTGKLKKEILPSGTIVEGEFINNGDKGIDGDGKLSLSNGFVLEGKFNNGRLNGEGRTITPEGNVYEGIYDNGEFKKGKLILKNGEYSEGNRVDGVLTGLARYYFKDGSYYEGECGDMGWQGIGTYVTKNGEEYQTEFPYGILDVFRYGFNSKIEEIHGSLNYVPKSEKEKAEEKNKYLEISGKGTPIQKEIAKFFLEEEYNEKFLNSLKSDSSVGNVFKFHKNILKFYEESKKNIKKIADKNHIEYSGKVSSYSYGRYFYELDSFYDVAIEISELFIRIYKFLNPENILKFITKREEMNKEQVILFNEFSSKYKEYIQTFLDWREYEKKFWKHNFKPDKKSK